jgi:hypothetical protein
MFMILDSRREDKRFWTEWQQTLPEFNHPLISYRVRFQFVTVVPKYLNCTTFLKHLLPIFVSWFWPVFWWQDSNQYLVFSVFTSRPTSLLASIKVCVFLYMVFILYIVRVLDQFWSPVVPCYSTEDTVRIGTSFISIPITRNYNHSQSFITLCHIYTAYNHLLQSYISWLLSYHLLFQIITEFTPPHFETLAGILLREFTS